MNNVINLNTASIEDQAIDWIVKIDRELSPEESKAFRTWLHQSPQHHTLFFKYAKLWDKMDAVSTLAEVFPEPEAEPEQHGWGTKAKAMAASFVLVAMLVSGVFFKLGQEVSPAQSIIVQQEFETTLGEQATFYMQDKTKVVLNTNSKVRVTYTDKQRLFELERGELHVTVAHNKTQPLSVYAGGQIIQAVGTAFNVEIQDTEVELIVTDGKVLVAEENPTQNPLMLDNVALPTSSLAVSQGQMVQLGELNTDVTSISNEDMNANLSWQQGSLIFRGESLEDALQEVSRYTQYDFEFSDNDIKALRIAGLFKTQDVDTLLAAIEQNLDISHQKLEGDVIRLHR